MSPSLRGSAHAVLVSAVSLAAPAAYAQDAAVTLDRGDTAWMLSATALVLFMTIPGLALFYGGLVRTKNALSVLMQCFAITALITLLWLAYGYSLAFSTGGMQVGVTTLHAFIGGLEKAFLRGVTSESLTGTIPEPLFFAYQMTFAIITPALIVGAFAERMKFSAMLAFMAGWFTLVYLPGLPHGLGRAWRVLLRPGRARLRRRHRGAHHRRRLRAGDGDRARAGGSASRPRRWRRTTSR